MARSFPSVLLTASTFVITLAPASLLCAAPKAIPVKDSEAASEKEMKPYTELVEHTDEKIEMLPIPGGKFTMGSPAGEKGRKADEGPQHEVEISPFWMAKCEIPWDVYEVWSADLDIVRRKLASEPETEHDKASAIFQISQPTKPYTDMTFGMGKRGYPAICMTQHSCRTFCKWLSAKTGRYYRLPTEAEWEYACRAGTKTAFSFGDDPEKLGEHAWFYDNSNEKYQKIGKKKPNPWGLHDMHGNVLEWCSDWYEEKLPGGTDPWGANESTFRMYRGGSWIAVGWQCRSASRYWLETEIRPAYLGFRVARGPVRPDAETAAVRD
jgi:formylglycine-generating enzyme required for sulfatase activity